MGLHGLHLVHSKAWEKHHELPIHGVRSQRQMHRLTSRLSQFAQPTDRIQQLVYEIKICPQAFSGDQLIELSSYFPGQELVLVLHLVDHHLFGLRCDQASQLLQKISIIEQRLDGLQVIDENLLDPINRFQLRNLFPSHLLPQVDQILSEVRGQSHIYGSIQSSRVIFLIDTSGSMGTLFQTNCREDFNRLEYIVHDLHKILHHRVQKGFKFNIIHFGTHVHRWKHSLTSATSHHLKEAEHYLDHLEPHGQTNTYEALKQALSDEEVDNIYLLSDGEPSMDTRTILQDLKIWLQQRRNPCLIHTVAFLMGHTHNDPKPREFMAQIAILAGGVFRCVDPFTPQNQEFGQDNYNDNPNFNDDEFVRFFQGRLADVPQQLINNVGLNLQQYSRNNCYPIEQQYSSSTISIPNNPYQQQYTSSTMPSPMNSYQQQYPTSQMASLNSPYQQQSSSPPNWKDQLKSRPRLESEIDIPSFHHEHGHDRFDIRLNIREIVPGKDVEWSLSHTFDEFKQLHHQLQKRCSLPIFPPDHHSLGHLSQQKREQRREELKIYLKQLYVYVSPYEHTELDLFLLMDLHINQIIQQAQIRWKTSRPSYQEEQQPPPPPPYYSLDQKYDRT